ncbi:hypothetical protein GOODEAATRI_003386 [Goodea atripinnis]|uniref:RRM domain-containing protein n=1 Tax=Goodea atripinnis TaxID=208336 RepID=A0ABV0PKI6_9TELE
MDAPPISITSSVPTVVTSGMRSSLLQASAPLFTSDRYDTDVYNPEAPSITNISRPIYRHRVNAQRPNLIGLTMGEVDQPLRDKIPNNSMRIVMESDSRKRPAASHDGGLSCKKPWINKHSFNKPNPQDYHSRPPFSLNAKLLVRQIPPELNNISKLNEHFSKFGTIVNLQNDPEGALIQFTSPEEAKRAMQSTEAVLNNRFIKVHWFRDNMGDGSAISRTSQAVCEGSARASNACKLRAHSRFQRSLSGVFNIDGDHKDCIQSCRSEGCPEDLRGSSEEEAALDLRLKGEFFHRDEAGASTPEDAALSGHGEGDPEVVEGVFHCMQLWTIDLERWTFLVLLMQTVWTYFHTLL